MQEMAMALGRSRTGFYKAEASSFNNADKKHQYLHLFYDKVKTVPTSEGKKTGVER